MKKLVCILLIFWTAACREWDVPVFETETALPNVTIGDLRTFYDGAELTIADRIELSGRVVSSDAAGNFYNTFLVDDGTGALEVMAGMYDLDATYHPGQRVSIRAQGLAVGWRDGVMQLGLPPEPGNRYATGYFYHPAVIGLYVAAERDLKDVVPPQVSISELDHGMCGRLVRIEGLVADDPASGAGTWAKTEPSPETGYVKFRTASPAEGSPADSITVITSGYATFAEFPVPRREVSLTGILSYGKAGGSRDQWILKLRDENDVEF